MRILVTGREGQVARSLGALGGAHELVFAARPDFDLADFNSVEACVDRVRPDLIISAAAYTAVDRAEDEAELAMRVNGEAPGVLARAAARVEAKIIHLSTDYVFSGADKGAWREGDAISPVNAYGRSKAMGEAAIAASGADHVILRSSWIYSPHGTNFVRTMLRLGAERDSVRVVDDQFGNPTSAADVVNGIAAVIARWQPGTYHLAGEGEASWAVFADAIFAESAMCDGPSAVVVPIATEDYPTRARRPANSRLDCGKFARTFGWQPPPWRDALWPVVREILNG